MNGDANSQLTQQIKNQGKIKQMIIKARQDNPQCIAVYFVRHKSAPSTLSKPKSPIVLFKKDNRIEDVMYSLYQQIEVKGLSFYVLKSESNDRFKYILLKPGVTIGKIFEEYSKNQYIPIIYHNQNIYSRANNDLKRTIIKYAVMLAFIFLTFYLQPLFSQYFYPTSQPQTVKYYPDDFQQN